MAINFYCYLKFKAMTTIQKKSLKVGRQVNTKHVDTVIKNYKQERWVQNSRRLGKEDSLSVWYSIEELEEFIAKSKEHGADGIKLYFGAYDKDYKEQPLFAGRQTVALVATKHKVTRKGSLNKDIYINTENGSSILAWNAGTLCPPYCGTKDDFGEQVGITIIDKGEDGIVVA
jgi:pyridoxine 5'-phosphate synthase PdxJ